MVVSKITRPPKEKEEEVEAFISQGGSTVVETEKNNEVRITLRCPKEIIDGIDRLRKGKPGRLSRNQAIVEALDVYLASK
jgi:hypothetical protein